MLKFLILIIEKKNFKLKLTSITKQLCKISVLFSFIAFLGLIELLFEYLLTALPKSSLSDCSDNLISSLSKKFSE